MPEARDVVVRQRIWLDSGRVSLVLLLIVIALLVGTDLVLDAIAGAGWKHVVWEGVVLVLAVGGAVGLIVSLRRSRKVVRELSERLTSTRADAERWRSDAQDLLRGLGEAIDRQFERWELTPAEREVAMELLKGLGHKQIAYLRQTSERTVRQQAHACSQRSSERSCHSASLPSHRPHRRIRCCNRRGRVANGAGGVSRPADRCCRLV